MTKPAGDIPFAMVPIWVLDAELTDRALRVWCVLAGHFGAYAVIRPTHATIARMSGRSRPTTKRALAELVEAGFVVVVSGAAAGKPSEYRLVW